MLPLRRQPTEDKSVKHFLQEIKETNLNAFNNQDYPFEELVESVLKKISYDMISTKSDLAQIDFGF